MNLSAWPLKLTKSAGAKHRGSAPLIVAGEGFFQNLTDGYGTAVTKRQAQIFQEKIGTLDVEITFFSSSMAEDGPSSFTGSFLALAEGDKIYMDAAQMKDTCFYTSFFSR